MLPFVYEFRWDAGHVIFLGAFFAVVAVIAATVGLAARRARRDLRDGLAASIRWKEDFKELPAASRACRHELTGAVARRACPNGFDCRRCETHPTLAAAATAPPPRAIAGFDVPEDRLYHRGHAWVRSEEDGTVAVGLDDFASRLVGKPDEVTLPAPGARVEMNGTGWLMRKGETGVRILSPIEGEVVETGGPGRGFYLRVRPSGGSLDARHLLRGAEVRSWMIREIERLQAALALDQVGISLADGGVAVEDLAATIPEEERDAVLGEMLLDP